jgi:uncharacterized protein YbjT (DUF2867 family)
LARHLVSSGHDLRLMVHRTPLQDGLEKARNVTTVRADLSRPETLEGAVFEWAMAQSDSMVDP